MRHAHALTVVTLGSGRLGNWAIGQSGNWSIGQLVIGASCHLVIFSRNTSLNTSSTGLGCQPNSRFALSALP